MERYRVKTNLAAVTEQWSAVAGPFGPYNASRECYTFTKHSEMVDAIHGSARPESAVLHRKVLAVPGEYPPMPPLPWIGPPGNTCQVFPPQSVVALSPGLIPEVPESWTEGKFEEFLRDMNKKFTSQFDETASLANFVYELNDFKDILRYIRRFAASNSPRGFARSVSNFLHDRGKQGIGGNFLDIELNWKSFIGDVPKILGAYERAMKRLEFLVGHAQFHTHGRRRFMIDPEEEGFETQLIFQIHDLFPSMPSGVMYSVYLVPSHCQVDFNASAFIDNKLELEGINAWWGLADTLGLNNSIKIIWNAVRLSWVMDMFVDSREFLDAFEVQAYSGALAVLGGSASWKVKRWYDVVVRYSGSPPDTLSEETVGGVLCTDYLRGPMNLTDGGFFALRPGLTVQQGALLSALVEARSGITSEAYERLNAFAKTFQTNTGGFGRRYWKRRRRWRFRLDKGSPFPK